jgi:hypothetical protein
VQERQGRYEAACVVLKPKKKWVLAFFVFLKRNLSHNTKKKKQSQPLFPKPPPFEYECVDEPHLFMLTFSSTRGQ